MFKSPLFTKYCCTLYVVENFKCHKVYSTLMILAKFKRSEYRTRMPNSSHNFEFPQSRYLR